MSRIRRQRGTFGARREIRALWTLVLALTLLAVSAASANAARTSNASRLATSSLCSVSRGVAADIASSTTFTPGTTASNLKNAYLKIQAAEPALLASASGPLKGDLTHVFAFVNIVIGDFQKADWNFAAVGPDILKLGAAAVKIRPQLHAVTSYFTTVCKLKP